LTVALTKIVERRRSSKEGRKEEAKQGREKGRKDLMEERRSNMTLSLSLSLFGSYKTMF
jgi:hypothetical protein